MASIDDVLSEDRQQLAHRARPGIGAARSGERQGVSESRTLISRKDEDHDRQNAGFEGHLTQF